MRPLRRETRAARRTTRRRAPITAIRDLVACAFLGVTALAACAGDGRIANDGAVQDSGMPPDGGNDAATTPDADSGQTRTPAHERLDCDLPAVIEYCGGATCHYDNAAQEVASSLVLWDRQAGQMIENVESRLVGVPATYRNVPDPERCPAQPELLVDPSDIERSLILRKLEATHTCGVEMPKFPYPEWGTAANPGPQREGFVSCVRDWVALLVEDYAQTQ